ncbi:SRPBCC family protein [Streptomyces sp. NPDC086182]|jgi:carbon monoxide dehydrogenase subunit G|uniref:SRPBCC family protein n=1 Tax=Streptomyces sp. NPDC086182 TaxID=3155058 RepID=UPI00343AE439
MVEVERTVALHHPLPDVVAYLADFAHAQEWDPGTVSCRPARAGAPVAKGAEWDNVSRFRGRRTELRYRLVRLEDLRLTFVGRNRTVTSTDDLTFRTEKGATLLTYRARIEFRGMARLASPFLRGEFERLGDQVAQRMPEAVNSHFGSGGGPAD